MGEGEEQMVIRKIGKGRKQGIHVVAANLAERNNNTSKSEFLGGL